MKKTTKVTAFILALVMVLSMTACQPSEPSESKATGAPTSAPTEGAEEPVVIEFWHQQQLTTGGPALTAMVEEFNANNGKGITVKEVTYANYSELMTGMQAALAGNNAPALAAINYANLNYIATNFPYVSPDDVVQKYFPDDADYLSNKYEQAILDLGVGINGDLVGLPYGLSIPVMYYNLDILKEAGLDTENLPTTWQEVRTYAETVVEKTDKYGLYIQMQSDTYAIIPIFYGAQVDNMYVSENGGYKAMFNTPKVIEVWTFFQEMYQNGAASFVSVNEGFAAFMGGDMAMCLTSSSGMINFREAEINLQTYYNPAWEGSDLAVCLGGNMLTMWSPDEAQQKAAWEFAKFLLEPDNMGAFDTATGYVPPTTDVTGAEWGMMDNPLMKRVIDEKSAARPWTSWPGTSGAQIDQVLVKLRDKICVDFLDVATVVADTEAEINELLGN